MNDTAAFSRDTGPGAPGMDNNHIPGRSYTSHQVEDTGCALCRTEVGYWEHDGTILYGTEGQGRQYVWTLPPQEIPLKCTICDKCLLPIVSRGDLELYLDDGEIIDGLSKAAIMTLFSKGARTVVNCFSQYQPAHDEISDFIVPLSSGEIDKIMRFADQIYGMDDIELAGKHYGLSALAFGKVIGDPSFDGAAAYYVDVWRTWVDPDLDPEALSEEELLRLLIEANNNDMSSPET